ncbi:MAG: phytanoyl-CoA dioxygenase family protein [Chloroflexi bacterium]|nr:phytanoyl-CoA dioxygenase family protein [Chloroflexota bacterium]
MPFLPQSSIDQFHREGYLVVRGLLDLQTDLQPLVDEYDTLLDSLADKWYAEGKLSSTFRDLPFGQKLTRIMVESGQAYYQHFDISLPQTGVKADTPMHLGPAVFRLLSNPKLLDVAECFVGPEIYSNPVQHVRIKPPQRLVPANMDNALVTNTDWHQDTGVVLPEADETNMLTVWLPITEATVENGCLRVVPRSHNGELLKHCPVDGKSKQVHIPAKLLSSNQVPVPMHPGDVLFMNRLTVHSSLPNISDDIRWSYDLRYNPTGEPTGRPWFPGFVARSRAHPETALTDPQEWAQLWLDARDALARRENPVFNRWDTTDPVCA